MLVAGKRVYPNLYDLGGSVWPAYESCPVYSPAGDLETRDVPQWQPEQLVSPRTIKPFSRPEQVHYCDKANGQYIFCQNDPLGLTDRKTLCEDKFANVGVKGQTVHTIDNEQLMCSEEEQTCIVMAGPGRFGSVASVLEFIKNSDKIYRRIRVAPFSQQFLKLILFNATTFDTVFPANYTDPTNQTNAFCQSFKGIFKIIYYFYRV